MKELFPYDTLIGDVSVRIEEVLVDSHSLPARFVDRDTLEVDVQAVESERWEEAEIRVEVTGPAAELQERTADWSDISAVAVLECRYSNTRVSVILDADPDVLGRWTGAIVVDRADVFGRATVRASVVATVEGSSNRLVGQAEAWSLSFDDDLPPSPAVTGSIKVQWTSFKEPDEGLEYLQRHEADAFYLHLDPDDPVVYLNSSFEGLEPLLADRRNRTRPDKALHDVTRSNIAADVWMALFNACVEAAEIDEDSKLPIWPDRPWQKAVLESLLGRMYPDRSHEDALVEALEAHNEPDGAAAVQERLIPAASAQAQRPRLLRSSISALSNTSDEEV